MLYGGGRHIEDLREIRDDRALRRLLGLNKMPALSTYGDWMRRVGEGGGVKGTALVNRRVIRDIVGREKTLSYTLDVDATVIEAEKQAAEWTYEKS